MLCLSNNLSHSLEGTIVQPYLYTMRGILLFTAVVAIFLTCKTAGTEENAQERTFDSELLFAQQWALAQIEGDIIVQPIPGRQEAHLLFQRTHGYRITGSTGCNVLTSTFELEAGGKLRFGPLATSKMACQHPNNIEPQLLSALEKVTNYIFINGHLHLLNGEHLMARYKPEPLR